MSWSLWLTLVATGALISFTPGAGAVNTMANSLGSGWTRSIWGILGQQVALLAHIAVVAAGVGVLVAGSPVLFNHIRYAGAAYLVYLGIRQFRSRAAAARVGEVQREPAWSMFRRGLLAIDVIVRWVFCAAAARGLGRLTQRESGQRTLNRVFGGLFVGVGVRLAAVH